MSSIISGSTTDAFVKGRVYSPRIYTQPKGA